MRFSYFGLMFSALTILLPQTVHAEYLLAHAGSTRITRCTKYERSMPPAQEGAKLLDAAVNEVQVREDNKLNIAIVIKPEKDWFNGAMFFPDEQSCRAVFNKLPEIHYDMCYQNLDCFMNEVFATAKAAHNS